MQNNIKETQINKAKSYKVSEDITIDKKYLEKKYPGKTVFDLGVYGIGKYE